MSIEFLQDVTFNDNGTISNLSEAIESHSLKAKAVRASTTISTIQNLLEQKCYNTDNYNYLDIAVLLKYKRTNPFLSNLNIDGNLN